MVPREIKLGASLSTEAVQKAFRKTRAAEAVQQVQKALRKTRAAGETALEAASGLMSPENSERADQKREVASMVVRRALQRATEEPINTLQETNAESPPIPTRLNDPDYAALDNAA